MLSMAEKLTELYLQNIRSFQYFYFILEFEFQQNK